MFRLMQLILPLWGREKMWFQRQISLDLTMEVDGEQRRLRNRAC